MKITDNCTSKKKKQLSGYKGHHLPCCCHRIASHFYFPGSAHCSYSHRLAFLFFCVAVRHTTITVAFKDDILLSHICIYCTQRTCYCPRAARYSHRFACYCYCLSWSRYCYFPRVTSHVTFAVTYGQSRRVPIDDTGCTSGKALLSVAGNTTCLRSYSLKTVDKRGGTVYKKDAKPSVTLAVDPYQWATRPWDTDTQLGHFSRTKQPSAITILTPVCI